MAEKTICQALLYNPNTDSTCEVSDMKQLFRIVTMTALSVAVCCAQVATGNIRGTVSDATGGVLPNCSVTITHTDTGLVRKVSTNDQGDFNAPSLPVGEYRIVVSTAGFQSKILSGLILQVDQTATIPIVVEPGAVTQSV